MQGWLLLRYQFFIRMSKADINLHSSQIRRGGEKAERDTKYCASTIITSYNPLQIFSSNKYKPLYSRCFDGPIAIGISMTGRFYGA
jgi:hypothetical protein